MGSQLVSVGTAFLDRRGGKAVEKMSLWNRGSMWNAGGSTRARTADSTEQYCQSQVWNHTSHDSPDGHCWPILSHLLSDAENMSWLPSLHFPPSEHSNVLNGLGVPGVMLNDGDSVNQEDKHQGFQQGAGDGDRMGPWLSLHEEMLWIMMMMNLKGHEQEQGHRETG